MFTDDISIVEDNLPAPVKGPVTKTLLRNENTQSMKLPKGHSVKAESRRDTVDESYGLDTPLPVEKSIVRKPSRIENNAVIALKSNLNFKGSCKDAALRTNQGMRFSSTSAERVQSALYKGRYLQPKPNPPVVLKLRERQPEKELAGKFRFKPRHSIERTIDYLRLIGPTKLGCSEDLISSRLQESGHNCNINLKRTVDLDSLLTVYPRATELGTQYSKDWLSRHS